MSSSNDEAEGTRLLCMRKCCDKLDMVTLVRKSSSDGSGVNRRVVDEMFKIYRQPIYLHCAAKLSALFFSLPGHLGQTLGR